MLDLNLIKKIHFVGVGGIGMSALAELLIHKGFQVSGSDLKSSEITKNLTKLGATINIGHDSKNCKEIDLLIINPAIKESNPELIKAKDINIPVLFRAELLMHLSKNKHVIAIAGTHGKTTTSSMLSSILIRLDLDPTCIVGGVVGSFNSNLKLGNSDYFVIEADESDGSFVNFTPKISVITNIDKDHMSFFKTEEKLIDKFLEFSNCSPQDGIVVINNGEKNIRNNVKRINKEIVSFSFNDIDIVSDYKIDNYKTQEKISSFDLIHKDKKYSFSIPMIGKYNVLNATASIIVANLLGKSFDEINDAFNSYKGVKRRMELLYENENVRIYDDYAHHPTEIKSLLSAFKSSDEDIIAVFEPHRFTRLKEFWNEFLNSFSDVSKLYVLPVFAASEEEITNINSPNFVNEIDKKNINTEYVENLDFIDNIINSSKRKTVLMINAGSLSSKIREKIKNV